MQEKTDFFFIRAVIQDLLNFLFFLRMGIFIRRECFIYLSGTGSFIHEGPIAGARHDAGYIPGYAYIPSVRSLFHTRAHFGNEVLGTFLGTQWKRVGTGDGVFGNNSLGTISLLGFFATPSNPEREGAREEDQTRVSGMWSSFGKIYSRIVV